MVCCCLCRPCIVVRLVRCKLIQHKARQSKRLSVNYGQCTCLYDDTYTFDTYPSTLTDH